MSSSVQKTTPYEVYNAAHGFGTLHKTILSVEESYIGQIEKRIIEVEN